MKKSEKWNVAYRLRRGSDTLLNNTADPFTVIPNSWRYWYADPHLIEIRGRNYIFAEAYDRVLRRGVIRYCELTENGASAWETALSMPFHLSYPHLIACKDEIYMIPESYVANEIAVYRAAEFPSKWEKMSILKSDFCAVDSTVLTWNDKSYILTFQFVDDSENLMLFLADNAGISENGHCVSVGNFQKRPAGYCFELDGKLIRPAQDCSESYGYVLNFYKITELSETTYEEELIRKLKPDELTTDLSVCPQGVHTYNFNDTYEVIDLKGYETDILFYIMRPIWFLWRRLKKLLHL